MKVRVSTAWLLDRNSNFSNVKNIRIESPSHADQGRPSRPLTITHTDRATIVPKCLIWLDRLWSSWSDRQWEYSITKHITAWNVLFIYPVGYVSYERSCAPSCCWCGWTVSRTLHTDKVSLPCGSAHAWQDWQVTYTLLGKSDNGVGAFVAHFLKQTKCVIHIIAFKRLFT